MSKIETAASNAVLHCLSQQALELLKPHLEPVDLPVRMQLERPHHAIQFVYFPRSGFASVVADGTGKSIEVGMVGKEGMTATALILGAAQSPNETYIQSPGDGLRIRSDIILDKMEQSSELRDCLLRYCHVYSVQVTQTCLSNGRGKLEERLARWLLMAHDRASGDALDITHEFLSIMLGTRRPGVTVALAELQARGLVRVNRGRIEIVDRQGLEDVTNGSYGVAEAEFQRLFTPVD